MVLYFGTKHGVTTADLLSLDDNSLTFTCGKDNHASTHTYPRSTDPSSNAWLFVQNVSTNKFTVNIGNSGIIKQMLKPKTIAPMVLCQMATDTG